MIMIKTLASLNADLASDIAFRYSNRLSQFVDMNMQAIHVEEVEGPSPGTGWVRNTLERGLLHTAQEEISGLIKAAQSTYRIPDAPIVRVGEREHELLREIKDGSYDLFMEGILNAFNPAGFFRRLQSALYRNAPCPILLVKNLAELNRTALLLRDNTDLTSLISTFLKIFTKTEPVVDLIHFSFPESGRKGFKEKVEDSVTSIHKNAGKIMKDAKTMLIENGRKPEDSWIIQDTPEKLNEFLMDYGLVVIQMPRNPGKKNRVMDLLSHLPTAILLCRKQ
jgi:hypothetical protein